MTNVILLTGASGFVGRNVLAYLLERTSHGIVCPVSFRHKGTPLGLPQDSRITYVYTDLRGELPDMLGPFVWIINLASESHVDRAIAEPVHTIENNVSSTLQVLEFARHHLTGVGCFIHFSTDEVFGTESWGTYQPSNPYAASKAAQEMCVAAYRRTYGVNAVITNANNLVGPGQNPEKFVPKLIQQIRAGKTVKIHAVAGVPGRRHYTPVLNAADVLLRIMRDYVGLPGGAPSRFPVPAGPELDNLEMARLIADMLGKDLRYELVEAETVRPGYDASYSPGPMLTVHSVPWYPPYRLEDTLREMITDA